MRWYKKGYNFIVLSDWSCGMEHYDGIPELEYELVVKDFLEKHTRTIMLDKIKQSRKWIREGVKFNWEDFTIFVDCLGVCIFELDNSVENVIKVDVSDITSLCESLLLQANMV